MVRVCDIRRKLLFLSSIFITLISIPLLLIFALPLLTYRYLVTILWALLNGFDGKIVSPESSTYAVDDYLSKPTCTLVIAIEFETSDSSDLSRKYIAKLQKLIDSGKYPEMQCYIISWMGFSFWKRDYSFNIDDHMHLIDHPMSTTQLEDLKRDLLQKPFLRNKPLWDMTRVTKMSDYKTVVLFRIHHSVADGYSVVNLTSQLRDNSEPWTQQSSSYLQKSTLNSIYFSLKIFFCGPTNLIYSLLRGQDTNLWKLSSYSQNLNCLDTKQIPLRDIKNLAKLHNVSVTSVLFAAFTGAVRNMMLKNHYPDANRLPEYITIICPSPLPGHPGKLSNHITMVPVRVPLGQPNTSIRLQEIQEELYELKNSTLPFVFSIAIKLIGSLPRCLIKTQLKGGIGTAVLSNFPGPSGPIEICGHFISKINVMSGIAHGIMGVNCGVLSYNGNFTISVGIDENIFGSPKNIAEFLDLLLNEFCVLRELVNENIYEDKLLSNLRNSVDV